MTAQDDPRPNWQLWLNVPSLSVLEGVALSMNIDPQCVVVDAAAGSRIIVPGTPPNLLEIWYIPNGFDDRLTLANPCAGEALPLTTLRNGVQHVRIGEFVAWATTVGWSLPPELMAFSGGSNKTDGASSGTPDLRTAVAKTISDLGWPAQQVSWKRFCDAARARCGGVSSETRGYGDKTIERVLREMKAD